MERKELDGLSAVEAHRASYAKYNVYCRAKGVVTSVSDPNYDSKAHTNPEDAEQKAQLLEHQSRVARIRAVEERIFETPPLLAWRQAFEKAKQDKERLSFKNWLKVGMIFQTEDGRFFLVGNMDVSGNEGGCCPINSITSETRIVRYWLLDEELPISALDLE